MLGNENISPVSFEKAFLVLFRQPALEFSRRLRSNLDRDPEYLKQHEAEVFPQLQRYLSEAGFSLDEKDPGEQMRHVVREVVVRLRSFEKGEE